MALAFNDMQDKLIEKLLICKNNITQLHLLTTVLNQSGWEAIEDKYQVFLHLFKKGDYEIGFTETPEVNLCVVRLTNMKRLPNYNLSDIFTHFKTWGQKGTACRHYGKYPDKIFEWMYSSNNFIRFSEGFNNTTNLFNLAVKINHSKSKNFKNFSVCNIGNL